MMTDELIFRSDALKALSNGEGCGNICSRAICRIPAVDTAPVVHAHWIEYYTDIMCSHCHATYKDEIVDMYQDGVDHRRYVGLEYCPHCGSIMIGDDEDD